MVNEQETLKELGKFCYKSMNKLLWIPIWAFILFPAIMELFGIGKNGSSNDDRYQRRGIAQSVFINTDTAKADYEVFCKQVLERNPNVYYK